MLQGSAIFHWRTWAGAGTPSALAAFFVTCGLAGAQPQQAEQPKPQRAEQPKATPVTKTGEARRPDLSLDQKINQARDEVEMLELQLETRRAQLRLAEARRAESRRWKAMFEQLWQDGFASEERYVAARDDVLMHDSRVEAEKSGVQEAELRVKQAKRRLAYGEFPLVPEEGRISEIEQRLGHLEKGLDQVQQEIASLKRLARVRWKEPDQPPPRTFIPGP